MTSYGATTAFSLSDRSVYVIPEAHASSDSENEQNLLLQNPMQNAVKKVKRTIDIEAIKNELAPRPSLDLKETFLSRRSQKKSMRQLSDVIIPTSPVLIEQLNQIKAFKQLKVEVPPETLNQIFSELRYAFVPALTPVYKQGDLNKKFYFIVEGKCVVMKPRERMVGSHVIDFEERQLNPQLRKSEVDPYGLRSAYPDYLILKVLFSGDSFGEAAIKMDTSRASTVLALENTHLLYLSEDAYMMLLDPYLSRALDEKIAYFSKQPLFANIDINDIMGVMLECRSCSYKSGQVVYEEQEKTKFMYFIISGQVELSKQVGKKNMVLSSYGESQQFGEIEIMNRIPRYTRARVITPRMSAYRIRKARFFDNLGNYQIYEALMKNSILVYKHWQLIYKQALQTQNKKDEVYQAAQDAQQNKPNPMAKHILNKKIIEGQGMKLNQVKVFQSISSSDINDSPNKWILQRVYSNTLQQYQARLLKKPQQTQSCGDDCVRSDTNRSFTERLRPVHTENRSSFHTKLPAIQSPLGPTQTLDTVLDSISKLPRVPRDNLVLSLMYQQAYKSDNPDKKAKQIQQLIQASFRNVRRQIQPVKKEPVHVSLQKHHSHEIILKNLKIPEIIEERQKRKQEFVNFVQKKQINS